MAFPTLPSGAPFEGYPLSAGHEWAAVQDGRDTSKVSSRSKWTRPRRAFVLEGRNLPEGDIHAVMGWIRDDLKGGASSFTFTNRHSKLWNPGKVATLSSSAGGALSGRTYYVTYTWSDGTYATEDSTEASVVIGANNLATIELPAFPTGVTQANIYIALTTGAEKRCTKLATSSTTYTEPYSTVDQNSASAQKNLYVASTTNFQVGDYVVVHKDGAREEMCVIASIAAGDYLTMVDNLTQTHLAVDADPVQLDFTSGAVPPTANDFYETVTAILDESRGAVVPVRATGNTWDLTLYLLEVL